MQRICTSLQQAGYDVLLIGRELPHSVALTERPYRQKRMKLWFKKSALFYAEYNIRILFYLLFARFDILCSIDLDSLLAGFFATQLKQKQLVHDAHELFTEMPELDENPVAKSVWNTIENRIFPKLKYAYTESKGYQEVYHSKYPEVHFEVIRNVPMYYPSNRQASDGEYILYQGAINVGRGLEQAIRAMKSIDYPLWIAGDGPLLSELKQLVKELQLTNRVTFLGMVKPEQLREITKNAKIGINLLSPDNRHYQLSFPNKLFDYIMAELPQISMDFPYYQEITESKSIGILINDLQVSTIELAIKRLLEDEQLIQESIEACRMLKQKNNWQVEEKKLIDFYAHIA